MGIGTPSGPATLKTIVISHIKSMRGYAEDLDNQPALIKRREVVDRILKCATELETATSEL